MTNRKNPYASLVKSILAQPYTPPKILSKPKLQDYGLSEEIIKKNEIDKKIEEDNKKTACNLIFVIAIILIFYNIGDIRFSFLLSLLCYGCFLPIREIFSFSEKTEIDKKLEEYQLNNKYFEYWTVLYPKKKVASYWYSLNGYEFEKSLAEVYKANGYEIFITSKSGDGGVDIVIWNKDKIKTYVQCKAFKGKAGVAIVRELYGVMVSDKVERGVVACLGGFTSGAKEFAESKNIVLLDVNDIIKMISI